MITGATLIALCMTGVFFGRRKTMKEYSENIAGELYEETIYLESEKAEESDAYLQFEGGISAQESSEKKEISDRAESVSIEDDTISEALATENVHVPIEENIQPESLPAETADLKETETVPPKETNTPAETEPPEVTMIPVETSPTENITSQPEGDKETEGCLHDFKKSIWENPTCMNGGYYNNICSKCGLVECVTLEALPHETEEVVIQEGNCMEDTVIRHICVSCGLQIGSDTRFTPQIHDWVEEVVDGKDVTYCNWCGVVK